MNQRKMFLVSCCLLVLPLTACGNQKDEERKLARGCEAAVKTVLAKDKYDRQIDQVKARTFGMSDGYRLVTIDVVTANKEYGYESDETFSCQFQEESSFGGMFWSASLNKVEVDGDIYGQSGGELFGDLSDQMNLTSAVEAAMK